MHTDNTIKSHPDWLPGHMSLRCLTPKDRSYHEAMTAQIVDTLASTEYLIPMTREEYDDTYTKDNEDVVYGIFEADKMVATSSLLHDVRAYVIWNYLVC